MITRIPHSIIWLLVAILYTPIFHMLYRGRWHSIDYTHAYFILPISLWLAFRKRGAIKELISKAKPLSNILYITPVIIGLLMYIFGWRQDYLFISTLSLIPLLYGLISYIYGLGIANVLAFPILYLLFVVPPPLGVLDSVTLPMRYGVSIAAEQVLVFFRYPILREGLLLSMGDKEIFLGQPCSGFRSLITMLALSLVYIHIIKARIRTKLILVFSVIPLALIGNLIRVIILCLITYYFGKEAGEGFFHSLSGAIIFIIILMGLLGLESLLSSPRKRGSKNTGTAK